MRTFRSSRLGLALVALSTTAACSSGHSFNRPDESPVGRVFGEKGGAYRVPSKSPHGEVRIAALGIAMLAPRDHDDARTRAMHVRLVADNVDDSAPWQLDTRQQIGSMKGYGQSRSAYTASSVGHPPVVTVDPGTSALIDLYYPLPASMQRVTIVTQFELLWHVTTPAGGTVQRAAFHDLRVEKPAAGDYYAWDMGWWGPSWFDPLWVEETFLGAPVIRGPMTEETSVINVAGPTSRQP
jgi:hypothetical protein